MTLKVGWFTTANGPGSLGMFNAALEAIDRKVLDAQIEFVFVNRGRGQTDATDRFMGVADSKGVPVVGYSSREFRRANGNAPWHSLRERFDEAVLERLDDYSPDIGMQAGYMLFAPILCERMLMLNQHPALPKGAIGKWQDAVRDAIRHGADETGSMVHVATKELDRGQVHSICRFPLRGGKWDALWDQSQFAECGSDEPTASVEDDPLFKEIRKEGIRRERPFVVRTLEAIANGRLPIEQVRNGSVAQPLDLTEEVEADIEAHAPSTGSLATITRSVSRAAASRGSAAAKKERVTATPPARARNTASVWASSMPIAGTETRRATSANG